MPKKKNRFSALHFTSTMSMSLVLFLIGLVSLLFFAVRDLSAFVRENITLSIILNDGIKPDSRKRIEQYLVNTGYAKAVEHVSKEMALQQHIESLGENPENFLGYNPLKASLEVRLNAPYAQPDSIAMIEGKLKQFEDIYRIAYQKDMVDLVNHNIRKLSFMLLMLALVLLVISVALIHNTVRLAIYSNRFIINTMKLIGANRRFVRKPYIRQGVINGLIASAIALIFISLTTVYILREFGMSAFQIKPYIILLVSATVIISGIAVTVISSRIAVGRYLRMKTDDFYYA